MLIHHLTEDDWKVVAQESPQIGYVFTGGREGPAHRMPKPGYVTVLRKGAFNGDSVQLPSGYFTPKR